MTHPEQHGHWDVEQIAALLHERDALVARLAECEKDVGRYKRAIEVLMDDTENDLDDLRGYVKKYILPGTSLASQGSGEKP